MVLDRFYPVKENIELNHLPSLTQIVPSMIFQYFQYFLRALHLSLIIRACQAQVSTLQVNFIYLSIERARYDACNVQELLV